MLFYYFDFGNYCKMVRLASREPNRRTRRHYLLVLLVSVPVVSTLHAICFFLDGLCFPGLWRTQIRTPVFILGHARSGTTFLHRLMSRDGDRFSSFVLYELYFPSLLQKRAIRLVASLDRRLLGGWFEERVRRWEEKRYAAVRQVHEMGLQVPEEDDLVFYYSCASGYWITKLPYMGELDFYSVDCWPTRKRRRLMRFYAGCVRRQLHLNGPDKIHLSKNPIFAGRVEALIEAFPDARMVVPLRNPYETIPSLLKLVSSGWKQLDWDAETLTRCLRILADQSFHTYLHPLEVLGRHPEVAHAIVDYRELLSDPAAAIEEVYRKLGFALEPDFRELLRAERKRRPEHVSGHSYSLEEFGLDAGEIRSRLAELFARQHWDERAAEESGGVA